MRPCPCFRHHELACSRSESPCGNQTGYPNVETTVTPKRAWLVIAGLCSLVLLMPLMGRIAGDSEDDFEVTAPTVSTSCPGRIEDPIVICLVDNLRLTAADTGTLSAVPLGRDIDLDLSDLPDGQVAEARVYGSSLVLLDDPGPSVVRPRLRVSAAAPGGAVLNVWLRTAPYTDLPYAGMLRYEVVVIPPPPTDDAAAPLMIHDGMNQLRLIVVPMGTTLAIPAQQGFGRFRVSERETLSLDESTRARALVRARRAGVGAVGQAPPPCKKQLSRVPCRVARNLTVVVL